MLLNGIIEVFMDFIKQEQNYVEVRNETLNFLKLNAGRIDFNIPPF